MYSYIAVVEKMKDGFHVHWEKTLQPRSESPPSEFRDAVNKVTLYGLGAFCIGVGLFVMAHVFKRSEKNKLTLFSFSLLSIIGGLACVSLARNKFYLPN